MPLFAKYLRKYNTVLRPTCTTLLKSFEFYTISIVLFLELLGPSLGTKHVERHKCCFFNSIDPASNEDYAFIFPLKLDPLHHKDLNAPLIFRIYVYHLQIFLYPPMINTFLDVEYRGTCSIQVPS